MAKKQRKIVHTAVELNVDVHVSEREVREFVKKGIDQHRAELLSDNKLASTPPVTVLSYKEIG